MPGPSSSTSSSSDSGSGAAPRPDRDPAVRRAVLDRVVDQVGHDLVQPLRRPRARSARAGTRPGADGRRCGCGCRSPDAMPARAAASMLASFSTPDRYGHTSKRRACSGTTPLSSRDRSSSVSTSRPEPLGLLQRRAHGLRVGGRDPVHDVLQHRAQRRDRACAARARRWRPAPCGAGPRPPGRPPCG